MGIDRDHVEALARGDAWVAIKQARASGTAPTVCIASDNPGFDATGYRRGSITWSWPTMTRFEHGGEVWKRGGDEMLDVYEEVLATTLQAEGIGLIASMYWEDLRMEWHCEYFVVDWRRWKQVLDIRPREFEAEGRVVTIPARTYADSPFWDALKPIAPRWLEILGPLGSRLQRHLIARARSDKRTEWLRSKDRAIRSTLLRQIEREVSEAKFAAEVEPPEPAQPGTSKSRVERRIERGEATRG